MLIPGFAAGYDTSKKPAYAALTHSIIHNPAIWSAAPRSRYCRKVVKEQLKGTPALRYHRTVLKEFEHRWCPVPQGRCRPFHSASPGRDERVFPAPMKFIGAPRTAATLAFGRGMHICLGQFLAQANVEEGTHLIANGLGIEVWMENPSGGPSAGVSGMKSDPSSSSGPGYCCRCSGKRSIVRFDWPPQAPRRELNGLAGQSKKVDRMDLGFQGCRNLHQRRDPRGWVETAIAFAKRGRRGRGLRSDFSMNRKRCLPGVPRAGRA